MANGDIEERLARMEREVRWLSHMAFTAIVLVIATCAASYAETWLTRATVFVISLFAAGVLLEVLLERYLRGVDVTGLFGWRSQKR